MDVKKTREALAKALTAHDIGAIKKFLHPSFIIRAGDGVKIMDRASLLEGLPEFFTTHPEYRQSVEIEKSKITGSSAILTTHRHERLHVLWWPHTVSSRWTETWKKYRGKWVAIEEEPISPVSKP